MRTISAYKFHLAALFTVTAWGATFVSTKVLIAESLSPAWIFFLRFALAYVCIWPLSAAWKNDRPEVEKAPCGRHAKEAEGNPDQEKTGCRRSSSDGWWRRLKKLSWASSWLDEGLMAAAGISGGSLYFLTENIALEYAPASNVSLIVCTAPVWTALLLSMLYRGERMTRRQIGGCALAFVGVVLVVLNGQFVLHLTPKGDLLALASALLWMIYSLVIKRIGGRYTSIFITRKVFFYGLLTILPVLWLQPKGFDPALLARPAVWGNLVFLGIVASLLCYVLWNAVIHRLGAVRATNYIYLNPLVTILTAALFIGERITPAALAGAALIIGGMWQAERARK